MRHTHTIYVSLPGGESGTYYFTDTHDHASAHPDHHTHVFTFPCSLAQPVGDAYLAAGGSAAKLPRERVGEAEVPTAGPRGSRAEFLDSIHRNEQRGTIDLGVYTVAVDRP